jgi:hypothetical protein
MRKKQGLRIVPWFPKLSQCPNPDVDGRNIKIGTLLLDHGIAVFMDWCCILPLCAYFAFCLLADLKPGCAELELSIFTKKKRWRAHKSFRSLTVDYAKKNKECQR